MSNIACGRRPCYSGVGFVIAGLYCPLPRRGEYRGCKKQTHPTARKRRHRGTPQTARHNHRQPQANPAGLPSAGPGTEARHESESWDKKQILHGPDASRLPPPMLAAQREGTRHEMTKGAVSLPGKAGLRGHLGFIATSERENMGIKRRIKS